MSLRYAFGLTALLLVAAMLVAGCGSDSNEASASSDYKATIVKADFIQAANAACEARNEEIKAKSTKLIAAASTKSRNAAAREIVDKAVAPGFEGELHDLRALEPPPGEEEQVQEVIDAIQQMVDRTRADLAAGRNYPYRKTENIAAAYGLPNCGRPE